MNQSSMPSPQEREAAFFALAVEKPVTERAAFLQAVCGKDSALRARLEALLAAHDQPDELLATPESATSPAVKATMKIEFADEPPDEAVGQTLGRYKLLEKVGEGGCGVVYVAEQTEPVRRRVALKVIKLGMDTKQVVARFEAERQALAMMDHPNIAKVLDAGTTDVGRPYFVMELVRGIRITDYCDQANLSTKERLDLFIKVCHAIQHAHQKGIIHRDIKPSNILVTLHDGVPVPKVIDFGIAKATEGRLTDNTVYTQLNQFMGTPAYMSPEQAEMSGLDIDTRSDIYSLGVLLYELLAGSTPFDAKDLMSLGIDAMRKTIREKEPVRPSTRFATLQGEALTTTTKRRSADSSRLLHQLKGDLDWIVMKCLEKDRTRRYDTANGLAADLKRHLNNEPVVARPPSAAYKFQKAFRRNKLAFTASAAVAMALLLGFGASIWQAVEATRARQAEKKQAEQARVDRDGALQAQSTAVQQRDLAQQRLYDSLVGEAHSIRTIRPLGFRRPLIDRLQQALAIPTAKKDMDGLRTEVAQCLGYALSFDPVNLIDPPGSFLDVAIDREGTLVAFGTAKGGLVLHETTGGKAIARLEHKMPLVELAFAPDGRSLYGRAQGPGDKGAEATLQTSLLEWRRAGDGSWSLQSERVMPDLRRLVATTQGVIAVFEDASRQEIQLVNTATDRSVGSMPLAPGQPFPAAFDVSADIRFAARLSGSETNQLDSLVEVWDLKANERRTLLFSGLGPVSHLRFSPDSRFLGCTALHGMLAFETARFNPANTYRQYMSSSWTPSWCGDGTTLAIPVSQESGVQLFSVTSGAEATRLATQHQVKEVRSSLDGTVLLAVHYTGPILVIRLGGTRERLHLAGHVGGATVVEFSPDGRRIASTGKDGVIRIWDFLTGKLLKAWQGQDKQAAGQGQTVAFSPDGRWLASGNYINNQVLVWALEDGRQVLALEGRPRAGATWTCAFSPDGRTLVAAGEGLRAWELASGTADATKPPLEARELFHDSGQTRNLQFHPTGKWIAFQGTIRRDGHDLVGTFLRGLEPGNKTELVNSHAFAVQTFGIDGDGRHLLSMDRNHNLIVSSVESRQTVRNLSTLTMGESASTYVGNFRVSPDGSKVAVANHNGRGVNIHDLASGQRLYTLPDDPASIWWLAWHPNGRHLAVARTEGDISLWNLSEVEALLAKVGLAP
jgi:WD40 repeat protein